MHVGKKSRHSSQGFTIVELLIVIVIIAILATITIIAYNGIQDKAKVASMQADLENSAKQLESYKFGTSTNERYPTDIATGNLKASRGNTFAYNVNNSSTPATYCLMVSNGTISYKITNTATTPTTGTCSGYLASGIACPSGFISVPGSATYGTTEFCVMKYEAKQASGTVPISQATGLPWGSISQTTASTYSANVAGCSGCHLITEAEWLTIAQNVLGVASNWSSGTVGSGFIYSGHNDATPGSSIAASTDDTDGYNGTGNTTGSNQRRTLNLSNGEVIWDLAGNSLEWTAGTVATGQPGASGYAFREWNAIGGTGTISPNPFPVYGTPAASAWSSAQGLGQVFSSTADSVLHGFVRGGSSGYGVSAGIYYLDLANASSYTNVGLGFRVSR